MRGFGFSRPESFWNYWRKRGKEVRPRLAAERSSRRGLARVDPRGMRESAWARFSFSCCASVQHDGALLPFKDRRQALSYPDAERRDAARGAGASPKGKAAVTDRAANGRAFKSETLKAESSAGRTAWRYCAGAVENAGRFPLQPSGRPIAITPPLNVQFCVVDAQLALAGEGLRGERLVPRGWSLGLRCSPVVCRLCL